MGIGTLGFLKGASKVALDSIDAREEAERELKKQQQLEQFRADLRQKEEMAKATSFQMEKDPETGKMKTVGYNSQGKRLDSTVRDATESEIASVEAAKQDRDYTLTDRANKLRRDEQVYSFANEDQRMQRESHSASLDATRAATAASNRSGRPSANGNSGGSSKTGLSSGSAGVADLLLNDYNEDIKAAGITTDQARTIAMSAITTLMSKGVKDPNVLYSSARASFESGVNRYIKNMMKDKDYQGFRKKRFSLDGSN